MGRLPGASLAPHLVLLLALLIAALSSANGQVYVNPDAPRAASTATQASNDNENLLTQTVYGFLDFTTTIGNTIMVFSPQSAPAAEPPKVETSSEPVIETRPPADTIPPTAAIQPSKTSIVEVTSSSGKESSPPAPAAPKTTPEPKVTTPKATTPKTVPTTPKTVPTTPKTVPTTPKTVPTTPKTVPTTPKTVPTTPKTVPTTPKTVPTTPKAAPTPSAVKKNEAEGLPPVILSSIVEVRTAEGPTPAEDSDSGAANQVGAEFYNFLSRQPSEVVEETFKVIGLKPSSKVNVRSKTRQSVEVRSRVNVVTQTDVKTRLSSAVHSSKSRPGKAHSKARAHHHHHDDDPYPTGLVTRMGGTMVADGITTVHETSVVGTIISGKYAQILQSTSHIFSRKAPAVAPSPSQQRILKTAAPEINATPVDAPDARTQITFSPTQRRPHRTDFLSKLNRGRPSAAAVARDPPEERKKPAAKPAGRSSSRPSVRAAKTYSNPRFGRTSTSSELATVSIFSDPPQRSPSTSGGRRFSRSRSGGFRPTAAATAAPVSTSSYRNEPEAPSYGSGRRGGFKPRNHYSQAPQSSHHDHHGIHASGAAASAPTTSLYKFKLARPTGRWQYKTSPKPRISIRRQSEEEEAAASAYEEEVEEDEVEGVPGAVKKVVTVVTSGEAVVDDDVHATLAPSSSSTAATPTLTEETINVEISTPADFKNTYYEIATIKSPYTFQVGTVKNTRFITVTSTHSRNLDSTSTASPSLSTEPLTENILGATATQPLRYENLLPDASIATLPAVTLTDPSMATPPLETMTETFNTTQLLLKTHVLPVVRMYDGETNILETATTSHMTLVQSYHVTRLVTAIKTLPPSELFHFVASKRLKEFNAKLEEAGSELLESELEVGENDSEDDDPALLVLPPDLDLANVGSEFDVTAAERARKPTPTPSSTAVAVTSSTAVGTPQLSPEQLQQLALLRLLNPAAAPQVLTTSRPVLKLETLYESHVIPVWNGATTLFSTISRPIATVSKTEYEYGTTAALPSAVLPPPPQPLIPNNPFLPQPQFTITSQPVVQQTMVTSTDSKILKLTFGAKTVYSTLYSTKVVPTVVTTYVTTSAPVAPVVAPAFPGYFPGGYAGFPAFVG